MKTQSFVPVIVAALLAICAFNVNAQAIKNPDYDYIVTLKGDTVKCKVSIPFLGGKAKYKLDGEESKKVDAADIKSYYVAKRKQLYRAVFHNDSDKPDFLTVVENGAISLYEIVYTYGGANGVVNNTKEWHIGKNSDVVLPLKTSGIAMSGKSAKERREELADLFKDKPEIYDRYKADDKFSFNQIRKLVKWYNSGVKPEDQADGD